MLGGRGGGRDAHVCLCTKSSGTDCVCVCVCVCVCERERESLFVGCLMFQQHASERERERHPV